MPRIQQYTQKTTIAGPMQTPGLPSGEATGQGLRSLGEGIAQLGEVIGTTYDKSRARLMASEGELELQQFAFDLQNGTIGEDGKRIPPPDPLKHMELYEQKTKQIRSKARETLKDDRAYSLFEAEFISAEGRTSLQVQKNRLQKYDEAIEENTLLYVNRKADSFVGAETDAQKLSIRQEVDSQLNNYEAVKGVEKRAALEKTFRNQVSRGSIVKMIRVNPDDAYRSLEAGEFNDDLSADEIEEWKTKSLQAKRSLSEQPSDPVLYIDLRTAAANGKNIQPQVTAAVKRGQLRISDANTLLNEAEQNSAELYQKNWFKSNQAYIDQALQVDPADNPFKKNVNAQAKKAWVDWATAHPNATLKEADTEAKRIVNDASLVRADAIGAAKLTPRFLKGTIQAPDIAGTVAETEKQYREGKIDLYERNRQMNLIKEWEPVAESASQRVKTPGSGGEK